MSIKIFYNLTNGQFGYSMFNFFPNSQGGDNFNFNYNNNSTPKYNENLRLINNKPEIASEEKLPEDKLIELKQSPARQQLSVILKQCDSKEFQYNEGKYMELMDKSGILEKLKLNPIIDKILISKTDKIISILNGINELDTANMTEQEMEAKVSEFNEILNKAREDMNKYRELMQTGADLANEILENNNSDDTKNAKLKALQESFISLADSCEETVINNENKPSDV